MTNEKLKKDIIDLYEKLERDEDLYKEFLKDEDKFLEARGFVPSEVKELVHEIVDSRKNILKDVLEEQSAKLEKKSQTYLIEGKNYEGDIFEWAKETLWWGRRVAACKAKIKNISKLLVNYNTAEINLEIFDKR